MSIPSSLQGEVLEEQQKQRFSRSVVGLHRRAWQDPVTCQSHHAEASQLLKKGSAPSTIGRWMTIGTIPHVQMVGLKTRKWQAAVLGAESKWRMVS